MVGNIWASQRPSMRHSGKGGPAGLEAQDRKSIKLANHLPTLRLHRMITVAAMPVLGRPEQPRERRARQNGVWPPCTPRWCICPL